MLKAIREDEDAVRSLGKNVYAYKMQRLILGGVIGALGGMIFAIGRQSVAPDSLGTALTFFAYVALILGGAARVLGPGRRRDRLLVPLPASSTSRCARRSRADHITFLVRQRGRHRPPDPRRASG